MAAVLAFATPDAIVVGAVVLFAWWGAVRGFTTLAIHTAGLYGGSLLGTRLGPAVGAWLARTFSFVPASQGDLWGWVAVTVACWVVVAFVASAVRGSLVRARLRGVDRVLGAVVGAAFAVGICAFAFTLWASGKTRPQVRDTFRGSVAVRPLARVVAEAKALFPDGVRERWSPVLESLDETK